MALTRAATFPSMNGTTSAAVTIQAIGDLVVAWAATGLAGQTITSMTDTNNRVGWQSVIANNQTWTGEHVAMWWGIATSTGATTVTPTYTAGTPTFAHCAVDSWTGATNWSASTNGTTGSSTSIATITYPSLSVTTEPSVYLGYATASGTFNNTATPGFTSSRSSSNQEIASNPSVTVAGSPYAPTSAATTIASYDVDAAIFAQVSDLSANISGESTASSENAPHPDAPMLLGVVN